MTHDIYRGHFHDPKRNSGLDDEVRWHLVLSDVGPRDYYNHLELKYQYRAVLLW
jgi:hypothetical protein